VYVFGGSARTIFNTLRCYSKKNNKWRLLNPDFSSSQSLKKKCPKPRTAHSACAYRDKVVLFGGCGAFMDDIGLRESFNDLWAWDTKTDSHWV
jgi:hypothetical protein